MRIFLPSIPGQLWGAVFHSLPLTYQQWGRLYQKFFHALVLLFAAQFAPLHLGKRLSVLFKNVSKNFSF